MLSFSVMTDIKIFCLGHGEPNENAFPVDISKSKTIGDLKKLIKSEKTPDFDDFSASSLMLWKVDIPASDEKLRRANAHASCKTAVEEILGGEKLGNSTWKIKNAFSLELNEENIHVIVECPPGKCSLFFILILSIVSDLYLDTYY